MGREDLDGISIIEPRTDTIADGGEVADRIAAILDRIDLEAEMLAVPEMDAGLVADFDGNRAAGEDSIALPDHAVLGFIGEVGGIEVEEVDVPDALERRSSGQAIPDCVVDRAGDDPVVVDAKRLRLAERVHQPVLRADDGGQFGLLLLGRRCCEAEVRHAPFSRDSRRAGNGAATSPRNAPSSPRPPGRRIRSARPAPEHPAPSRRW
jgi:hypothetical protein